MLGTGRQFYPSHLPSKNRERHDMSDTDHLSEPGGEDQGGLRRRIAGTMKSAIRAAARIAIKTGTVIPNIL